MKFTTDRPLLALENAISIYADQTMSFMNAATIAMAKIENYAVRFGPIASNCAFCSSLSVA